jgi:hypothetical protein
LQGKCTLQSHTQNGYPEGFRSVVVNISGPPLFLRSQRRVHNLCEVVKLSVGTKPNPGPRPPRPIVLRRGASLASQVMTHERPSACGECWREHSTAGRLVQTQVNASVVGNVFYYIPQCAGNSGRFKPTLLASTSDFRSWRRIERSNSAGGRPRAARERAACSRTARQRRARPRLPCGGLRAGSQTPPLLLIRREPNGAFSRPPQ